jgi:hypothetical protein
MFLMLPLTFPLVCGLIGLWLYLRQANKKALLAKRAATGRQFEADLREMRATLPSASLDDLTGTLTDIEDRHGAGDLIDPYYSGFRSTVEAEIASRQASHDLSAASPTTSVQTNAVDREFFTPVRTTA